MRARVFPRGIYGRFLFMVIGPILVLQIATIYIYFEWHWSKTTQKLSQYFASSISFLIALHQKNPTSEADQQIVRIAAQHLRLSVRFLPIEGTERIKQKKTYRILYRILYQVMRQNISYPFFISSRYRHHGSDRFVYVRIRLPDTYLDIIAPHALVYASRAYIGIIWIIALSFGLILISILFVRKQVASVRDLANAAEDFGKGRDNLSFKPTGPLEVRRAALAFLRMRSRIKQHIEQRTLILAGVSHDLRTALTKLNLNVALLKGVKTEGLKRDIQNMESILESYLEFAKSSIDEKITQVHLQHFLIHDICDYFSHKVTWLPFPKKPIFLDIRPVAFRRCISNIIDNALKYGTHAWLSLEKKTATLVHISIFDNGPGMREEEFIQALKPFASGRTQKGMGLGLAIAHDVVRTHGGELLFSRSPYGGACLTLALPIFRE